MYKKLIEEVFNDWGNIKKSLEKCEYLGEWRPPTRFDETDELSMLHCVCYFLALPDIGDSDLLKSFLENDELYKHPCGYADECTQEYFQSEVQFRQAREVIKFCTKAYRMTGNEVFKIFLKETFCVELL